MTELDLIRTEMVGTLLALGDALTFGTVLIGGDAAETYRTKILALKATYDEIAHRPRQVVAR